MASNLEYLDNPAGRLKKWVERFQSVPNKDITISEALANMLDVSPTDVRGNIAVSRLAMQLAGLADDIRANATLLPDHVDADLLIEDFDQFDRVFDHMTMARQVRVSDMLNQVDAAAIRSLDHLSRQFHRYCPEPTVNDAVRGTLLDDLRNLRNQVEQEDSLDAEVRNFILTRFAEVERSLREYLVTGAAPVELVTDSLIGSIQRQPTMWRRIAESAVADTVSGIVVALFVSLSAPPAPDSLPPATPQPVINNYVEVYNQLPAAPTDAPSTDAPPDTDEQQPDTTP